MNDTPQDCPSKSMAVVQNAPDNGDTAGRPIRSGHSDCRRRLSLCFRVLLGALATLGMVMAFFGVLIVIWQFQAAKEWKAASIVEQLGGHVIYAWRLDKRIAFDSSQPNRTLGWLIPGDTFVYSVSLYGCELEPLDQRLACLESCHGLRLVNLADTSITDVGLEHLASLSHLEWLSLSGSRITDAGLHHLNSMGSVKTLVLANTPITDVGLRYLATLQQLEWLDLRGTQVSRDGVAQLHEELPTTRIATDFDSDTSQSGLGPSSVGGRVRRWSLFARELIANPSDVPTRFSTSVAQLHFGAL